MAVTYFEVKNVSDSPISIPFNKSLLNPEELQAYYEFKKSDDYLGFDAEERSARLKRPESDKALPFFDQLDKGVMVRYSIPRGDGTKDITYRREWILPGDYTKLLERPINYIADLCSRFRVLYSPRDTKQQLVDKLKSKLGESNKVILSDEKEVESGNSQVDNLRPFIRTKIVQRLKPGQTKEAIIYSGLVEITEVTQSEDELPPVKYTQADLESLDNKELRELAKGNGQRFVGVSREDMIQSLLNV